QLEGQLGFTLCQRGRGGFSLTEKGQQFLQQAIRVLSELNELERQSALLKGEYSGTLCISTLDSIETETALSLLWGIGLSALGTYGFSLGNMFSIR
ncbi:hypothetical protein ACTXQV_60970, partial [Klebsiella pneumoniae]